MKRLIGLITILVLAFVVYANNPDGKLRRVGSTYKESLVIEKTGAGSQEMIAGITGQNLVIYNIVGNTTAANRIYFGYAFKSNAAADGTTKISPIYDVAAKTTVVIDDTKTVLPTGEGLDCWSSADPNEGWFKIDYEFINYSGSQGSTY